MTDHLTNHDRLMLNAGQLLFPSRQARAVGLALASLSDPMDRSGCMGRVYMNALTLSRVAGRAGVNNVTMLHILDRLEQDGYIRKDGDERPAYTPMKLDTSVLPLRITSDDAPESTAAIERLARGGNPLRDGDQVEGETFWWEDAA